MPSTLLSFSPPPPQQTAHRYHNLIAGAEEVESGLHRSFGEHLNAEIVLQTITSVDRAIEWLKTTFMFIR